MELIPMIEILSDREVSQEIPASLKYFLTVETPKFRILYGLAKL
jgi:hypothetical protein